MNLYRAFDADFCRSVKEALGRLVRRKRHIDPKFLQQDVAAESAPWRAVHVLEGSTQPQGCWKGPTSRITLQICRKPLA